MGIIANALQGLGRGIQNLPNTLGANLYPVDQAMGLDPQAVEAQRRAALIRAGLGFSGASQTGAGFGQAALAGINAGQGPLDTGLAASLRAQAVAQEQERRARMDTLEEKFRNWQMEDKPVAAKPETPEVFGAPQQMVYQGKPAMVQVGNRGTVRPIEGAAPYQAPKDAAGVDMQLIDVVGKDGTTQKQWVRKGESSGIPIGEPKNPNTAIAGREAQFLQRVISSAELGAKAISNVTKLPVGASTGIIGVGASPGHSIFGSVKGVLQNKMSGQEVQDLNTMLVGLSRNLAGIETQGLAPQGAFTESFNALAFREGDTEYTKLRKLAEMRQIVEYGLKPLLDNPRVPQEQKDGISRIIKSVTESVPYQQDDVTALQQAQAKNSNYTLNDLIRDKGLSKSNVAVPDDIDALLKKHGGK